MSKRYTGTCVHKGYHNTLTLSLRHK